jgi:hypothetical protein
MPSEDVLEVLRVLGRCRVEDIRTYGKTLGRKRGDILLDSTRIHDALIGLWRKGKAKRNDDGTWEVQSKTFQSQSETAHAKLDYVYPREMILEAIKDRGGKASVAQIYEHIAKVKGKPELTRREQNTIRMAIFRLRKSGEIEREAPQTYRLRIFRKEQ